MTHKGFIFLLSCLAAAVLALPSAARSAHLVYARQACTILNADGTIAGYARKALPLVAEGFRPCSLNEIPDTALCKVRDENGVTGFIYRKYLVNDREESCRRYMPERYDSLHRAAVDRFGAGSPLSCDYFPTSKPHFSDRPMPASCYSLYITSSPVLLKGIDEYIELARETCINTFVIDIKEDGIPGFKAEAMKKYSPTAYNAAGRNKEALYRETVQKLHEAGFWVVGRIVTFKDCMFTNDHPECALVHKDSGELLYHNKSNWPSAFSRLVWEYNVELAVEAVEKLGFDEINFDYVRFPDRLSSLEKGLDMRNRYGESKVQAIQNFVTYAADRLHECHAYISIDVFGASANPGYTTPYGQYWPAISNVADVICGMPYPDHFANGYYGIQQPWNEPYRILSEWSKRVLARQAETPSPAIVRTWIQAYHVMKHVDPNGIDYDAANIEKEIRALFDNGLTGGYMTWLPNADIDAYRRKSGAFKTDYYKEHINQLEANNTVDEKNHYTGTGEDAGNLRPSQHQPPDSLQ